MKIVIITGQTATGKTAYAVKLAKKIKGELINCDSRQIYKHLDIVTGKDKNIIKDVTIHLYDLIDPKKYFSSFDYTKTALPIIKDILNRVKIPIIVGGTYLYLAHLLYEIETENIRPDWKLRKSLANKTVTELQELLKKINVQSFNRLNNSDKNNPQRLIRKIEVASTPNQPPRLIVEHHKELMINKKLNIEHFDVDFIGFYLKDKNKLKEKIVKRVEDRLNQGVISEVKNLLEKGYTQNDPGMRTIGCQQIIKFLQNKITKDDMINEWINKEIQYAKRQYTFMKKDQNIIWKIL